MTIRFTLDCSPPRTKKNSPIIVQARALLLPSKAYRYWFEAHEWQLTSIRMNLERQGIEVPYGGQVSVNAQFYCDNDRADCVGLYQALGDLLEWKTRDKQTKIVTHLGLIMDDRLIRDWDGSRVHLDKARPRIEVIMTLLPREQEVMKF